MRGKGLSMTLVNCKTNISSDKNEITKFFDKVVNLITMNKLGKLVINEGSESLPGLSAVQMIETSHIALHTFSNNNCYMFSVESCKSFDASKLTLYLMDYFGPKTCSTTVYDIKLPKNVEK